MFKQSVSFKFVIIMKVFSGDVNIFNRQSNISIKHF